jgi:hypothetical protein
MSDLKNTSVRATVKAFADDLRRERGISPSMMQTSIEIAVERLREEHGIDVSEDRLAKMAGVR